jgi:hypothetical protein
LNGKKSFVGDTFVTDGAFWWAFASLFLKKYAKFHKIALKNNSMKVEIFFM